MQEGEIIKRIRLKLAGIGAKLFRNNTGVGWQGKVTARNNNSITISGPRPLRAGLFVGSPDIIGWTTVKVTEDMVGHKVAIFTGIEVKSSKRQKASPEQERFIDNIKQAGGIAGVAYTPEDAADIVTNYYGRFTDLKE